MSELQAKNLEAKDRAIRSIRNPSEAASPLINAWKAWYKNLAWFDFAVNPRIAELAAVRFNAIMHAQNLVPAGATFGAVYSKPTAIKQKGKASGTTPIPKANVTEAVRTWQGILGIEADGVFGPRTETATKQWQQSKKLTADGIVGAASWKAANPKFIGMPILKKVVGLSDTFIGPPTPANLASSGSNDSGLPSAGSGFATPAPVTGSGDGTTNVLAATKIWQKIVGVATDGQFGAGTEEATKIWQGAHGIATDGIVGPATWKAAGYSSMPLLRNTKAVAGKPKPGAAQSASAGPRPPNPMLAGVSSVKVGLFDNLPLWAKVVGGVGVIGAVGIAMKKKMAETR